MSKILDGKALAQKIKVEVKARVAGMSTPPTLAIISVGDDPASEVYIRGKLRDCAEVGIHTMAFHRSVSTTREELFQLILALNADPVVTGIMVQLPLPYHIDRYAVMAAIDPKKDVDCLNPYNVGRLHMGLPGVRPCTPAGIIALLDENSICLDELNVAIVGRSDIVGKPLAAMMTQRNATVTLCHTHTPKLRLHRIIANSDILVTATGDPNWLREFDEAKYSIPSVVIDVGINRALDGHIFGDMPISWTKLGYLNYTPVPGGVGPMTRAMLLKNVVNLATQDIIG